MGEKGNILFMFVISKEVGKKQHGVYSHQFVTSCLAA